MLVTVMLKNSYLYLEGTLADKIKALNKASRLKNLMLHFICVPAKWIKTGKSHILSL
jgi:hypothetical protein